jgi:hypothetical protein
MRCTPTAASVGGSGAAQNNVQWIPACVIVLAVVIDLVTTTELTSAPLIMAVPVAAPLLCSALRTAEI